MCGCDRKKCAQCVGQQTAFFVLPATEQLINQVSPVWHLSVDGLSFFQAEVINPLTQLFQLLVTVILVTLFLWRLL